MRSNSPFRQNSCAKQKAKMKAEYEEKDMLKEYEKEVKAFGCVKGKWQSNLKEEQDPKPAPTNPSNKVINDKEKATIQK
tara:strand:+ start:338 stop:574 length:237 start_codon:yes stop_codon:yes gene_type:complete